MTNKENFNVEVNGVVVNDVAEKIGSLFGENGKRIGKIIDDFTENVTIKIGNSESDKQ